LAKPLIQPIFVLPSSLIAIAPFRYLWNHPPSFVGKNVGWAFFMPVIVFFVIALALSYLMTVCWSLWKSN
jgi:cytochrome c-type biogenesis protein CcmH/NrfG